MGASRRTDRPAMRSSSAPACGLVRVFVLCVVCGLLPSARVVRAELFTALVELERLLEAEALVAGDLRQYVAREQERLQRLLRSVSFESIETVTTDRAFEI
jgi:hypothetical protein